MVPTADARMKLRSQSMEWLKIVMPSPLAPSTADLGSRQSSKASSLIGDVWSPSLWNGEPMVRPGVSRGTRNAVSPAQPLAGSSVAKITKMSATGALVMNVLLPVRTQPSSLAVARVLIENESDPAPGSVIP